MKRKAIVLLMGIFCTGSNFISAQLSITDPADVSLHNSSNASYDLKYITLSNGVRLQYAEQGKASDIPVIFLHGITDSWHSFEKVLQHLPENIHAFAMSQRGHGNSDRPASGYKPADFANDIAEFIRQKKLDDVIIVGHSMGGLIVQQFALDHPELARGAVIIDSDASFKDNPGMPEFYQLVLMMEGGTDKPFMEEFQRATLAKPIDSSYFDTLVAEGMKVPLWVFKTVLQGLMETDLTNDLKKINMPVMILWGDKDEFCFRSDQEALAKAINTATFIVYKDTGHALHWEEPERFASDLLDFINRQTLKYRQ